MGRLSPIVETPATIQSRQQTPNVKHAPSVIIAGHRHIAGRAVRAEIAPLMCNQLGTTAIAPNHPASLALTGAKSRVPLNLASSRTQTRGAMVQAATPNQVPAMHHGQAAGALAVDRAIRPQPQYSFNKPRLQR